MQDTELLMQLLGFIIFRGLGKNSKLMSNIGLILIACGVWAFILGMVTNGFIGDLFPRWILGGAPLPTTIGAIDAFVHPENHPYNSITSGCYTHKHGSVNRMHTTT